MTNQGLSAAHLFPDAKLETELLDMIPNATSRYISPLGVSSFFRPDTKFIKWLVKYAAGRIIIDIGCGNCNVLNAIKYDGGYSRIAGIEPMWDNAFDMAIRNGNIEDKLQILANKVEDPFIQRFMKGLGKNVLYICCRPSHSGFVANALRQKDVASEFLYITKPDVLEEYDDLEEFARFAVPLEFEGSGRDGEKVWSIQ
jgi:hypothetical protein